MYGYPGHFPNISPVGAPPHIGPVRPPVCCCPPIVPVAPRAGVAIIAVAILILIALGVIF
ncbi:hypothetical protein UF75_5147 [Desulfosporosinus sp. I2]|uniref:hypothetical protein n=1 Tax=Desulfosporosinus sp. I2 TaxID=1617025 RepID=UPI0005ED6923|nr:hypothetical protein [Desulfosporosinus sp. I2]KJR44464.1 hypothetical protein UF75_5147 [Desulfosporosinus sp. I2]